MARRKTNEKRVPSHWTLSQRLAHYSMPHASGCILWTKGKNKLGYGTIGYFGKSLLAHRAVWIVANGPIPAGLSICHRCDVPACINLDHLFVDTHAGNMADMKAKGRQRTFRGETSKRAKLTDAAVREIRASRSPLRVMADRFGVTMSTISRVRREKGWVHV